MVAIELMTKDYARQLAKQAEGKMKQDRYKLGAWVNKTQQELEELFLEEVALNNEPDDSASKRTFVILFDNQLVGKIVVMRYNWPKEAPFKSGEWKLSSWILPAYRNQNIGFQAETLLGSEVQDYIDVITVATVFENKRVIHMLTKLGWEDKGEFWMGSVSEQKGWHHFQGFQKHLK